MALPYADSSSIETTIAIWHVIKKSRVFKLTALKNLAKRAIDSCSGNGSNGYTACDIPRARIFASRGVTRIKRESKENLYKSFEI